MGVGHVHRRAFIAHVDDAHVALRQLIPDRLDMSALEAEHAVDLASDEKLDDEFGHGTSI